MCLLQMCVYVLHTRTMPYRTSTKGRHSDALHLD